jgi:hypothetical protein
MVLLPGDSKQGKDLAFFHKNWAAFENFDLVEKLLEPKETNDN